MGERRQLGVQDALWLEMDRPTNLMVVDSLVWTATPMDWARLRAVARERLWDRYQVFRSVAVQDEDGAWHWEEQAGADPDRHMEHVVLPQPGDDATLQAFIGSKRTVPLDRTRPLWHMYCIDGFKGGSAIVTRTHHAIADGIRMVQLSMSLFDASPEGGAILAPPVRLHGEHDSTPTEARSNPLRSGAGALAREVVELGGDAVRRAGDAIGEVVADPIGVTAERLGAIGQAVGHVAASTAGASFELATTAVTNPVGAAHSAATMATDAAESTAAWLRRAMQPHVPGKGPLVDFFSAAPGDLDIARKLLIGTRNDVTVWTGSVGAEKAVAWAAPLPLADVKAVARATGATVNDVLVASVAGALHAYLDRRDAHCASVNFMIPVNLKPLDTSLPGELGNGFAIVQLELPTDESDPLALLEVVRHRMGRIKNGHEAAIAFRIQEIISGLSKSLYQASVELLANRALGVLTNVPGPPMPVYLAGEKVAGVVGWAPLSGNQPMSFTIYSYDGKVFVGIACDVGLVPDHEQIVDGFVDAFERLAVASR